MNPRTRIITLRLMQRINKNQEYAKEIGIEAKILIFPKEKTYTNQKPFKDILNKRRILL